MIFAYAVYKWYLVSMCMKKLAPRDKFVIVSWIYESWDVANVPTVWPSKKKMYSCVCVSVAMNLSKEQNIIIIALRRK